jgi:hypothetical protein
LRDADNKRALKVIRTLRSRQGQYGKQIDVLCRDMVSAHEQFAVKLSKMNFVTCFYESLLGCSQLEEVLDVTVDSIRSYVDQSSAAIFLLDEHGFDVHVAAAGVGDSIEKTQFQEWFTRDLVDNISRGNRVCPLSELLQMGLQAPPAVLKTISAAAIPLGKMGQGVGFVLVYRPGHLPLQKEEMSQIAAAGTGLRKAIERFGACTDVTSTINNHIAK